MARTLTIAIVGADGSGKTTLLHRLLQAEPGWRQIYMGASIESANYSLPTSRWLIRRKRRALRGFVTESDAVPPAALMTQELRQRLPQGRLFKAVGLVNRIAEEWYRLLVVALFRLSGHTVLCDRHFLFEYCPDSTHHVSLQALLSERIHRWQLSRLYPQPHLVVFLDAPVEILHARKPEWTLEHLARQREGILEQARCTHHFARVDATQTPEAVFTAVMQLIEQRRHRGPMSRTGNADPAPP